MKGSIVQCLEQLVTTKYGKDAWESALSRSGVRTTTVFIPIQDVEDDIVMKLVTAVCELQNLPFTELADAFGEYWVMHYSQDLYSVYYLKYETAKAFLLGMDDVHVSMTVNIKDAKPPRFQYEWSSDNTLLMHYKSHRPLIDFMVGLIKGVGKFYRETLEITKLDSRTVRIVFLS